MFIFLKGEEITFQMHVQNFVWLPIILKDKMLPKDLKLNI